MNQRIRELATQAHEYALEVYEKRMQNEVQTQVFFYQIRDDKFVKLIVQECASIITNAVDHREPASTYVKKIKQHFGVEKLI